MEYISSDTNVWLDFVTIDRLDYPFRLPYTYLMNDNTVQDELLSPPGLGENLKSLGLQETELTEDEFFLAEEYMSRFAKPSMFDCIALAIAKKRGIVLLTELIEKQEYAHCLEKLLQYNGGKVRLPERELKSRIEKISE